MIALLCVLSFVLPLPFMNEVVIFTIYVTGCNFMIGRLGYISFGQPAYLAIGAYSTAFYLFYFGSNPLVGILVGVLGGLVGSLLIGPFFVRLRSDYFAMVNLALAVVVFYLTEKVLVSVTQGDNGLWFMTQMSSTPLLDLTIPSQFLAFGIIVTFFVFAFYKYLDGTIYGSCCLATKLNEDKLQFIGYSNFRIRFLGFVIANTTAALAGAMYAVYLGFVESGNEQPLAGRRSHHRHASRRGRDALWTGCRRHRLHRHERRNQQVDRQLGIVHRLLAGIHHAGRRQGNLGHVGADPDENRFSRKPQSG